MSIDTDAATLVIDLAAAVAVGSAAALQAEFWRRIRKRIASEVSQRSAIHVRCDAPFQEQLLFDNDPPRIDGTVSILFGDSIREQWDFTLSLPMMTPPRDTIDWGSLVAGLDAAMSFEVDVSARRIGVTLPMATDSGQAS